MKVFHVPDESTYDVIIKDAIIAVSYDPNTYVFVEIVTTMQAK